MSQTPNQTPKALSAEQIEAMRVLKTGGRLDEACAKHSDQDILCDMALAYLESLKAPAVTTGERNDLADLIRDNAKLMRENEEHISNSVKFREIMDRASKEIARLREALATLKSLSAERPE